MASLGAALGQKSGTDAFDDVPAGYWLGWAVANGVTVRVGEDRFDPEAKVARAQVVTFLYRTVNLLQGNRVTAHAAKGTIAFGSRRDKYAEVFLMPTGDISANSPTTTSPTDWDPSWSPDGPHIAYTGFQNHTQGEIQAMDINGTTPRRLAYNNHNGRHDGDPCRSPDGTQNAF